MKIFEIIDYLIRRINSMLFRIVLIGYSTFIVFNYPGMLDKVYYFIAIILYFIIFYYLHKHSKHKLRLINDFLFIIAIVFGKNPNEILIFIFIILPIINSINFSGDKKTPLLYIYSSLVYIGLFLIHNPKFEWSSILANIVPLVSLIPLWTIDLYTSLRSKIRNFRENINDVVDGFYLNRETILKPHRIYGLIIDLINRKKFFVKVNELMCFTIVSGEEERVVVVNGSKFIWRYDFLDEDFLKKIREREILINTPLKIDGNNYFTNLCIYITIEETEYIYVFLTKMTPYYSLKIGTFRCLIPSLAKMSKILISEMQMKELRKEEFQKLSERRLYVNRANKTMHFIRNRLTPISNLIKMIDNSSLIPKDKLESFEALLIKEKDSSKEELYEMVKRADYLLDKSNNPFNFSETTKHSLRKVYSLLRTNFSLFFPEKEIIINGNTEVSNRFVFLNEEGFIIFLSDWFNNIFKYRKEHSSIEFNISDEALDIIISNDYKIPISEVKSMIKDLMSADRNEIIKRTTHGLFQIKSTLEEMSVPYTVRLNKDSMVEFILKFKIYEDENSSI